jgi:hypothetical protein
MYAKTIALFRVKVAQFAMENISMTQQIRFAMYAK